MWGSSSPRSDLALGGGSNFSLTLLYLTVGYKGLPQALGP